MSNWLSLGIAMGRTKPKPTLPHTCPSSNPTWPLNCDKHLPFHRGHHVTSWRNRKFALGEPQCMRKKTKRMGPYPLYCSFAWVPTPLGIWGAPMKDKWFINFYGYWIIRVTIVYSFFIFHWFIFHLRVSYFMVIFMYLLWIFIFNYLRYEFIYTTQNKQALTIYINCISQSK